MKFYAKDESVFTWVSVPEHLCGWNNLVHGGVISAILDEIMGRAAMYHLKLLVMTKSMTIDFLKPVFIAEELKAEGKALKINNNREALFEGHLYNKRGKLCARSTGIFALFKPEALRKKGVVEEKLINDLERLVAG
jgi:uncharacterized protein (TIGR00369 family)